MDGFSSTRIDSMVYVPYLYALYMSLVDVLMMSLLKARHVGSIGGTWVFPLTMFIYATQPIMFYFGLSFQTMGILNVLWNAVSSILVALTGFYLFNEKITARDCVGIVLCVSGIVLLGTT